MHRTLTPTTIITPINDAHLVSLPLFLLLVVKEEEDVVELPDLLEVVEDVDEVDDEEVAFAAVDADVVADVIDTVTAEVGASVGSGVDAGTQTGMDGTLHWDANVEGMHVNELS